LPAPIRFLHSADWHLGLRLSRLGSRADESARWRFEAVEKIQDLARRTAVDFILVAGDVFQTDSPRAEVIEKAALTLARTPVPTILIPGNHDPLEEASVWKRDSLRGRLERHRLVRIAVTPEPISLADGAVTVFPAPCTKRSNPTDLAAALPSGTRGVGGIRVGLVHGRFQGYHGREETENSIASSCVDRAGLDYLAMGDFHSYTADDHPAARQRARYSGTIEATAIDESRPGHVLLVEIAAPGAEPVVTPIRVGHLEPRDLGLRSLTDESALTRLRSELNAIPDPERTFLRLKVAGVAPEEVLAGWIGLRDELAGRMLGVDLVDDELLAEPTDEEMNALGLSGDERDLLRLLENESALRTLLEDAPPGALELASRPSYRRAAVNRLYALLRGEARP
jgi:DNA repair exonuclease SbcCD nuclease subunit